MMFDLEKLQSWLMEKIKQVGLNMSCLMHCVLISSTTLIVPLTDSTLRAAIDVSEDLICVTVSTRNFCIV